jgi:hypothetical protein
VHTGRNRQHAILREKRSRCQAGSRRATVAATQSAGKRQTLPPTTRHPAPGSEEHGGLLCAAGRHLSDGRGYALPPDRGQSGKSPQPEDQPVARSGSFVRYLREKATRRGITLDWIDEAYSTKTCSTSSHQIFGQDTPAFRPDAGRGRNGRLLSVAARPCEKRERSRGVTASVAPHAGNSERHRPQGRGDRGCLWCVDGSDVDGSDSPPLGVSRPPDANRVRMCGKQCS